MLMVSKVILFLLDLMTNFFPFIVQKGRVRFVSVELNSHHQNVDYIVCSFVCGQIPQLLVYTFNLFVYL